ncbi:MAG TPA: hypothetical protein GX707_01405 [Epulopiscium sp.]|nr:hypothetical protein [Candidatus Epulonipiscium sp.]
MPTFKTMSFDRQAYYILNDGGIAETFDTQAVGALETGLAKKWFPHYLATVIIAVDRQQTDVLMTSWEDLYTTEEDVSFMDTPGNVQMLIAAMSYGLEGEDYTLTKAIKILRSLNEKDQLKINSFDCPIIICYDYQAAALIQGGRNIEIIIPKEGTFTYEKGLLAIKELHFKGNVDQVLLASNLRLLNGESNASTYPNKEAYEPAIRVSDYQHFANMTKNINSLIERKVFNAKKFMSVDHKEHLHFALIYIIIITIWSVSLVRRSMQKGLSYAAFFTGIILNSWVLVRLIKYQIEINPVLIRYLWYAFYIFQLTLPLVLVWMAWAIDKPDHETFPPKWWQRMGVLIGILIILVFTNDLHGLVLRLDLNRPDWNQNYGYGLGYYVILFVCMGNLIAVFTILIYKGIKNPRKKGMLVAIGIFIAFGLYNYKYIMRDPLAYETDITIVTGLFTMLMFESCIRSGLIPVNTKYIELFTRSPLNMQLISNEGEMVLASKAETPINKETIDKILVNPHGFTLQEDDTVLSVTSIPGGYAMWHEDISKLYQLKREINTSTQMLKEANAMLIEEEKRKRLINEEKVKRQLMDQLEDEISQRVEQLTMMIERLPGSQNLTKETTCIALLLCYIKRRCNLFFTEKETDTIASDRLGLYIEELSEMARYSQVHIITISQLKGRLPLRYATLFYDFLYEIICLAYQTGCSSIIGHLGADEESFIMGFLPSEDIGVFKIESEFIVRISAVKGKIIIKELEDTKGIHISFPRGGGLDD